MEKYSRMSWPYVVKELKSNEKEGLSQEYISSYEKDNNKGKKIKQKNLYVYFIPYSLIILIFPVILYTSKLYISAAISLANLLLIFLLIIFKGKERKIYNNFSAPFARVVRDGKIKRINPLELIKGDIVYVDTKEICPVDIRIINAEKVTADEGHITGNYNEVIKYENRIEDEFYDESSLKNILFKGSKVIKGSIVGIAISNAGESKIDSIMERKQVEIKEKQDFKIRMKEILKYFFLIDLYISIIFFLVRLGFSRNIKTSYDDLVSVFVIGVPFYMVFLVFMAESIFKVKLRKRDVKIKNIFDIELISRIRLIMSKMLGIFTKEQYIFRALYTNERFYKKGYIPHDNDNVERLLTCASLCNRKMTLEEKGFEEELTGLGYEKSKLERKERRLFEIPFEKETRLYLSLNKVDRNYRAYVKGDVASILNCCSYIMKDGIEVPLTEKDIVSIKASHMKFCFEGYEVMAYAYRNFNYEPSKDEKMTSYLVFVGMAAFENPLEDSISYILYRSRIKSIKPIIFTKMHKLSAKKIGKELGIVVKDENVLTEVQINNMEEGELGRICEKVSVVSDVTEKNKQRFLEAFEKLGYITAYCGEKISEMGSLKAATCAIAFSENSNETLKNYSNMYIKNMSYELLISIIENCDKFLSCITSIINFTFLLSISSQVFVIMSKIINAYISLDFMLPCNLIIAFLFMLYETYNFKNKKINVENKLLSTESIYSIFDVFKYSLITNVISIIIIKVITFFNIKFELILIYYLIFFISFLFFKKYENNQEEDSSIY